MNLAQLRKDYGAKLDALEALAEAGGEPYETALKEVNELRSKIERLDHAQKLKAESATPLGTGDGGKAAGQGDGRVPATPKTKLTPGAMLSRSIVALVAGRGDGRRAAEWATETWGEEVAEVAKALSVGVGPSGGFLVPTVLQNELIELLRPASVVMSMNPRILQMPNGNLTIPRVATGAQADYVGENTNMMTTEQTLEQISLSAKKLAALVPMSNDLLRYPTQNVDSFVREDLVAALAQRADLALIRSVGTQFSPKGLRQWAIEVPGNAAFLTANTTVNLVNVTADLARLELALLEANVQMRRPGWLMSPRTMVYLSTLRDGNGNFAFPEMGQGMLRGKPFKTTTQIPNNIGGSSNGSEVYLVDFAEFIVGESLMLEVNVVQGAAYHNGSQVISGLSQDQTVVQALTAHDAAMRQVRAVAVLNDVRWFN